MSTPPRNVAASVRERLRQRAHAAGRPFEEFLTYYAIERFLFRLSQTQHRDRFVLKGALMLPIWGSTLARATRDIDLLGRGQLSTEDVARIVRECLAISAPPDGIAFDAGSIRTSEIRDTQRYGGIRATFLGHLERARINMQVDVGLGDVVTPGVVEVTYPVLLDLPAPELSAYPVETAIAEKLEAIVDLGVANSRMKDFFDLWTLLGHLELDGNTIANAVSATFARRGTDIPSAVPIGFSDQFASDRAKLSQWSAFTSRLRLGDPPDLAMVIARISAFAVPVFVAATRPPPSSSRWVPERGWEP